MIGSQQFAEVVAELVEKTGRSADDVRGDAEACLDELASTIDPQATQPGTGWAAG